MRRGVDVPETKPRPITEDNEKASDNAICAVIGVRKHPIYSIHLI